MFFPKGLRAEGRLRFTVSQFSALELDTTFYALPSERTIELWSKAIPAGFSLSLKAPRVVTHGESAGWLASAEARTAFDDYLARIAPLGRDVVTLLQFPPTFVLGEERALERFLAQAVEKHPGLRLAVEFRHRCWWRPSVTSALANLGVIWVAADLAGRGESARIPQDWNAPFPPVDTGGEIYLRLCGQHGQYEFDNHELFDATPRLRWWLERLGDLSGRSVRCVIGNSYAGHAPATANRLRRLVGQAEPPPIQASLFDGPIE